MSVDELYELCAKLIEAGSGGSIVSLYSSDGAVAGLTTRPAERDGDWSITAASDPGGPDCYVTFEVGWVEHGGCDCGAYEESP